MEENEVVPGARKGRSLFSLPEQGSSILLQLELMRLSGVLVDVIIEAGSCEFPCHRVVLAANSQYFKAMFSYGLRECHQLVVPIHGVSSDAMQTIVQYVYTGQCFLSKQNAAEVLIAADLFQMLPLKEAAVDVLMNCLDPANCLLVQKLADHHSCKRLARKATKFSQSHFTQVILQEEFMALDVDDVTKYLSDDEITVNREDTVFDAVMRWIKHTEERSKFIPRVLRVVRLPFLSPEYLQGNIAGDPLIRENSDCKQQVNEAREFQISGRFPGGCDSAQRRPRRSTSKEVLIVFGGETRVGNFHECVHDVSYYDPGAGAWETLALVPGTLHAQAFDAVSLDYDIYITGGAVNNTAVADVRVFYTYLNKWCTVAPMIQARYHHAAVVVNNHVYAVGGTDGKRCLDHVEKYNVTENKWVATEPLVHAVKCPAVAAHGNKMYVFGGFTDAYTISQSIQVYDPIGDGKWIALSCPSIDYTCAQAVPLGHKIYLLGGCSKTVKVYDPETDAVVRVANMGTKRDNCGATVVSGKIYVTGGVSESNGSSLDTAECYCPISDRWQSISSMPKRLYRHGSVSIRIPIYRKESRNKKVVKERESKFNCNDGVSNRAPD